MKFKYSGRILMALAALTAGAFLSAAGKPLKSARNAPVNWNQTVAKTDHDSYILGKPNGQVKLVEFISYTCSHCAHFEQQSADQLKLGLIQPGKGSVEVRSFVRDPIDMTVAVLTHCVPKERFFAVHSAFLRRQDAWIAPLNEVSPSERQRWFGGDLGTRMRYIATDFKFYDFMATQGFNRTTVDRCLADTALAGRLAQQTQNAVQSLRVNGTPSFLLDGVLLAGTSEWSALRLQIEARLR